MARRFIIRIVPKGSDDAARLAIFKGQVSSSSGPTLVSESEGLAIAAQDVQGLHCGDHGIILGTLFRRGEQNAVKALSHEEQMAIIASRGRHLVEAYWGPYVACLPSPDGSVIVLRAPWGELPCYRFASEGAQFFASDIDLLVRFAGYRPSIAWNAIIDHLIHGTFYHRATCLEGVQQCPGGERLTLAGEREQREDLWSPWHFTTRDRQVRCPREASDLVRQTALGCIGARASQFEHVMVTLSGGLDSSIVAASLAAGKVSFSAMTLVTGDLSGDERRYASQVSAALAFPLTTQFRDVTQVDVRRSGARGRPFPCVQAFFTESMRLAEETAAQQGAQALFNGGGGDTLFCTMQSGAPAADRLLAEGVGRGFLHTLSDISQSASASIWAVLRDALARAWFGRPAFRHRPRFDLLTDAARQIATAGPAHPWLIPHGNVLPGKAFHVWGLAFFKSYVECLDPQSELQVVAPLLSQPLVEACLTIPSWLWFDAGHNRIAARRAFDGLLPAEILSRRSKGVPTSFSFEIMETHRDAIRSMLIDGQLARQGLIDLPGALAILDAPQLASEDNVGRVLGFLDVEAWASGWSAPPG